MHSPFHWHSSHSSWVRGPLAALGEVAVLGLSIGVVHWAVLVLKGLLAGRT